MKNENSTDALRFLRTQFEKAIKEKANSNQEPIDYELPDNENISSALNNQTLGNRLPNKRRYEIVHFQSIYLKGFAKHDE